MIVRLDYDDKNEDEVIEWINYASEMMRIKVKDVILRKKQKRRDTCIRIRFWFTNTNTAISVSLLRG